MPEQKPASSAPRLLDLFAGEGGAGEGYRRAGFEVVGVELNPRRAAYNPHTLIVGDVLELAPGLLASGDFAAVHASPPCQKFSVANRGIDTSDYRDLIAPTRALLEASGLPWVIENVPGAPLRAPLTLCGSEFGLGARGFFLARHRLFESPVFLFGAGGCSCWSLRGRIASVVGGPRATPWRKNKGGLIADSEWQRELVGCPWMSSTGVSQAIPPAYTQHIGEQLLAHVLAVAA